MYIYLYRIQIFVNIFFISFGACRVFPFPYYILLLVHMRITLCRIIFLFMLGNIHLTWRGWGVWFFLRGGISVGKFDWKKCCLWNGRTNILLALCALKYCFGRNLCAENIFWIWKKPITPPTPAPSTHTHTHTHILS